MSEAQQATAVDGVHSAALAALFFIGFMVVILFAVALATLFGHSVLHQGVL